MNAMDFKLLEKYIESLPSLAVPGASCTVYKEHKQVFHRSVGHIDLAQKKETTENSLYYMYSVSKPMTAAAVLQLVERGQLSLEDELCKYLPAFTDMQVKTPDGGTEPAQSKITIFQLLTMTGGLSYEIYTDEIRALIAEGKGTTRNIANAIANIPLSNQPGTCFQYSFGMDILGAVVEEITGMSFGTYMKRNIFEPLEMDTAAYSEIAVDREQLAEFIGFDSATLGLKATKMNNDPRVCAPFESGGAGVICSTKDMILFADALACGGVGSNGNRILSEQSVEMMSKNYLNALQLEQVQGGLLRTGYGYGMAVRSLMDPQKVPTLAAAGEFGWGGACGTYILCDRKNKVSIAFGMQMTSHMEFSYLLHPHNRIRDLTYEGLKK